MTSSVAKGDGMQDPDLGAPDRASLGPGRGPGSPEPADNDPRRLNWALNAFVRSATALIRSTNPLDIAERVCEAIVLEPTYRVAWVGLTKPGSTGPMQIIARAGPAADDPPQDCGSLGEAHQRNAPDPSGSLPFDLPPVGWLGPGAAGGISSSVSIPIGTGGGAVGVLMVYASAFDAFGPREVEIFQKLADEIGFALSLDEDRRRMAEAEAARQLSEARYRLMFNHSPDGILVGNGRGGVADANPRICRMLGYTVKEIRDIDSVQLVVEAERAEVASAYQAARAGLEPKKTWLFRRKDGSTFFADVTLAILPNDRVVATVRDATDRIALEQVRRSADQRYRSLFDQARNGILITDRAARILDVNPSLCRLMGYARDEQIGRQSSDFVAAGDEEVAERTVTALTESHSVSGEIHLRRRDGVILTAEFVTSETDDGTLMTIIRDVTEHRRVLAAQKEATEALQRTRWQLARVARLSTLGETLATISHELNQPLAAVMTNGDAALRWLAKEPANLEEARAALTRIVRDAGRANAVVGRARTLVSQGPPRFGSVDLNEAVNEVLALVDPELRRAGVVSALDLAVDAPKVYGDRIQIQQVVINLVLNAIDAMKDNADRNLRLGITTGPSSSDDLDSLLVSVMDSGRGLPPGGSELVFEHFYTTKAEGMGLGLAISKSIIESHGGRIWAETAREGGAVFHFTLQRADGAA